MYFASTFEFGILDFLVSLFFFALCFLLPVCFFALVVHLVFSIPFRRRERARFFLDFLETALSRNIAIEQALLSASKTCDPTLGVRFYMVATYVDNGMRLGEALERVPRFLPPQMTGMLRLGEKLGDLKTILPACREVLRRSSPAASSAIHYMIGLLLIFSPLAAWIVTVLNVWVIPQFRAVVEGMGVTIWPITQFTFDIVPFIVGFELGLFFLLLFVAAIYVGGPGFARWFRFRSTPIVDWIAWKIPWKRKRFQRAFSAMLAVLLDGGVPEAEAVRLAGESMDNEICKSRARMISHALSGGVSLDTAIELFDDTGEFQWRLANALHARGGFLKTLKGWHESLDAKAFQQEEATAHAVTSGLVIVNGFVVGLIAIAMFGILIAIMNGEL